MSDIKTRPFSKNYSGLINQTVIAIGITALCVTTQEILKRRRRGKALTDPGTGLGSRESWEFGYLYNGRAWARFSSPPSPGGWPLSWVKQVVQFPEDRLRELRGLDATIYIRFLRGCFWFSLIHVLTTFPILFPIHVKFSDDAVSPKSMTRASISSLVTTKTGLSLLWIHICLLFWLTVSWIGTLFWISDGAFKLRAANINAATKRLEQSVENPENMDSTYYQHPHPQYGFKDVPSRIRDAPQQGIRLRTIMVANIPTSLRNEKDLQEYFEYYMSRKVEKPSMGLTSSMQPGFLNKSFAFIFNRAKRIPSRLPLINREGSLEDATDIQNSGKRTSSKKVLDIPVIERVVVARKMTELASLLERREEILVLLETAHIKLANKALLAVKAAIERKTAHKSIVPNMSRTMEVVRKRRSQVVDPELGEPQEGMLDEEERMEELIEVLGPFVEEFGTQRPLTTRSKKAVSRTSRQAFKKLRVRSSDDSDHSDSPVNGYPPPSSPKRVSNSNGTTIWDALLSLPRSSLDAYQPLVNLRHLFTGKVVPSIDYYTAKLNLLTSLITENRAKAINDYDPVSTAFVTFADPADAKRACKYLAVHPNNPLACLVTMAPAYHDIDWIRVMKTTYRGEFVKDWVVSMGVWAFTLFWLFPVSLLVGLVSIQNISLFWPSLKRYLDHHEWQSEVLQSFIPTLLVALLALLIPLVLLLIAKKAHTIPTLSALHDLIMTRYYKFLIVNVLVFFCVGTAALQSFLNAFRSTNRPDLISVIASSFPTAGPFYVGWLIFTTAIHGGFELALLGLPLILYPTTSRQVTPRKRAVGIRPRTFNFYYWLPNHTLVIHVLLLFSVLNPFVLPFGALYFFIQSGVVKNQLIHVYAKNYEADGRVLLIRIIRYSLDGLVLAQAVFLAYMVVLKKTVNVGLSACLIIVTVFVKLIMTRMVRAQYERDDIIEAEVICKGHRRSSSQVPDLESEELVNYSDVGSNALVQTSLHSRAHALTWKLPAWVDFSYSTWNQRGGRAQHRLPNPFGPHKDRDPTQLPIDSGLPPSSTSKPGEESISSPVGPSDLQHREKPRTSSISKPSSERDTGVRKFDSGPLRLSGPVVPHPYPVAWDDQFPVDLPYDNPFYTRTIDNVLWLPRNPAGVLDLDDTVELRVAIPVEPSAGRLGTWLGLGETASPDEMSEQSILNDGVKKWDKIKGASTPALSTTLLPEVNGTEDIELPPAIAKRVQAGDPDIQSTLRHRKSSVFQIRKASMDKGSFDTRSTRTRRPSVLESTKLSSYRSFSDGLSSPTRPRSASMMTTLQVPGSSPIMSSTDVSLRSPDQDFAARPDTHAQAEFVAANASRVSLAPPKMAKNNVSASQAIYHEVLEEERRALHERIQEEAAEAQTMTQSTKSWLTSWMFKGTT